MQSNNFNYFNSNIMAFDPYSDNCPSYVSYQYGDCRIESNHLLLGLLEEEYGWDSRCFMGTIFRNSNKTFYDEHYTNSACFRSKVYISALISRKLINIVHFRQYY